MGAGVLGGAVLGFLVAALAQVADVVEQRGDQADDRAFAAEALGRLDLPLVARHQPRHRQRDVERVLHVVVQRVDALVARRASAEHLLEAQERALDRLERRAWPGLGEQLGDRESHGIGELTWTVLVTS